MRILGIESSCDETAAAVVDDGRVLLSNVIQSQIDIHKAFGGVVPEVAARSHLEVILPVIEEALSKADSTWDDIDAIAITYAPGLVGSLLIGSLTARMLAMIKQKPLFPIHHVEAHMYANFLLEKAPSFPVLALIVSGGHSQLVLFRDHGDYTLLGQTQDDAVGEAFDKVAKITGLPYPGGPSIAKAAEHGDPFAFKLPKSKFTCKHSGPHGAHTRMDDTYSTLAQAKPSARGQARKTQIATGNLRAASRNGLSRTEKYGEGVSQAVTQSAAEEACHEYDFSFSGLKTAALRALQAHIGEDYSFPSHQLPARLDEATRANMAASFQHVAIETLVDKAEKAYRDFSPASVVIAGGVAANQELRQQLSKRLPLAIDYPDMSLCTDNAAMIATLGYYEAQRKQPTGPRNLEVKPSLSM